MFDKNIIILKLYLICLILNRRKELNDLKKVLEISENN
jgi:hypothetical protein